MGGPEVTSRFEAVSGTLGCSEERPRKVDTSHVQCLAMFKAMRRFSRRIQKSKRTSQPPVRGSIVRQCRYLCRDSRPTQHNLPHEAGASHDVKKERVLGASEGNTSVEDAPATVVPLRGRLSAKRGSFKGGRHKEEEAAHRRPLASLVSRGRKDRPVPVHP
jgi:hypothetical protein